MAYRFLEGVHVLDVGDERSHFCAEVAARLGATVRRIHRTSELDAALETDRESPAENLVGGGSAGRLREYGSDDILARALSWADVLVLGSPEDEHSPSALRMSCPSLLHPSLIVVSVSDFGQTGPYRDYVSCNLVASALGGQMCRRVDGDSSPVSLFGEQAYHSASLFAAIGMLLAIIAREDSRTWQHVEISLHEAAAAVVECRAIERSDRSAHRPLSRVSDPFIFASCADGYALLSCDPESTHIVSAFISEDLGEVDRGSVSRPFASLSCEPWGDVYLAALGRWASRFTRKELYELGQLMRLPWAPVFSAKESAHSPQHVERKFAVTYGPDSFANLSGDTANSHVIRRLPFIVTGGSEETFSSSLRDEEALSSAKNVPLLCCRASCSSSRTAALHDAKAPLRGVRVLDLSRLVAGPYATRMLADYGAEVIKIQSRKAATGAEDNLSPGFAALNRNKLGVTLDMDCPEARAAFLRLVGKSDVVIENFTPRVMSNWALGYDRLKDANGNIIMVRMSAMGQTGPWRDYAGLAPTIHAFSGITAMTSGAGEPVSIPFPCADVASALYAVIATLGALRSRHMTGTGCLIDLSEYETMCSLMPAIRIGAGDALSETRDEGFQTQGAPERCMRCSGDDEWCAVAVFTDRQWNGLRRAIGNPPWTEDERYETHDGRCRNRSTLNALVQNWTAAREASSVMEVLQSQGVPCGIVRSPEDLLTDPQLIAGRFLVELNHPAIGPYVSFDSPIESRSLHRRSYEPSPVLGQHNWYVFHDLLGMSNGLIDLYAERGVFG